MFVIRFVVVSKNKTLKKLCLIYWEIVPKKNPDGKLKQEFILVWCDAPHRKRKRKKRKRTDSPPPSHSFFSDLLLPLLLFGCCSNALRSDLLHPNEYVRGSTLRFLCKLKEAEIFEPLVPSIRACLVRLPPSPPSHFILPNEKQEARSKKWHRGERNFCAFLFFFWRGGAFVFIIVI
jgi:coatomer subunit beta